MKKATILTAFIIACITLFSACTKSSTTAGGTNGNITFSCSGITPGFTNDIQPILNTVCSINSNCHGGGSTNSGGPLTNYAEVNARKSNIRAQILAGTMPQSGTITQAQINAFICWIDSGANNN